MIYKAEDFADLARSAREENAAERAAVLLNAPGDPAEKLEAFNALLDLHGVEALRVDDCWRTVASYANTGDPYIATLIHEHETGNLVFTSYADWLTAWENREEY